ncbi:MAG TPA: carboxyl transferase domain-containing protein [bacterium]|nr:carboxyl transferase domain-containing protein [bacterium]
MLETYNEIKTKIIESKISTERTEFQHNKNKLTAEERIDMLADKDTFVELNSMAMHRCVNFDMPDKKEFRDGIITGSGKINGRLAYISSQDFTFMGGSMSETQGVKVCNILKKALECGTPFIQINDSGGARIQEGILSLEAYGKIFRLNSVASGVIPQISAILGPCAGGAVYSPALTDFVFMVKDISKMFITGPNVIKQATSETVTVEELGGAMTHNHISGNAHFYYETEQECFAGIKKLLSFLPSNNSEQPPAFELSDSPIRSIPHLDEILPDDPKKSYDMKQIIISVLDNNDFFEVHQYFAQNAITGFGRLNGKTVGITANQPKFFAGCLDINSSDKISRFVRFCDCFNIPIINFVDVPGYLPGVNQEYGGVIRHGAKILYAFAEATVPKISLITRKAFGGAYIALASQSLGYDRVISWPKSDVAVLGAEGAVEVIYGKEIAVSQNPELFKLEKINEYKKMFSNPIQSANLGIIDMVIEPQYSRIELINSLEMTRSKKELRPYKKHGNMPL